MASDFIALCRAVNANQLDSTPRLVLADYCDDIGWSRWAAWMRGHKSAVGLAGIGGIGGIVGLGGRGGRGGIGGIVGVGGGGVGGRGGLGGLVGVGVGGGGVGGRGGLGGLYQTQGNIVLIPGENALVFLPHGYGCSVIVGHVASENPNGWVVDPAWAVEQINPRDASDGPWAELALGEDKQLREGCRYSIPFKGGFRVPAGAYSVVWHGDLPNAKG